MSTVPDAPTAVTPSRGGSGSVLVTFTPPGNDGGEPISLYTVTAVPDSGNSVTSTGPNSPIAVNNLENGTSYKFRVVAANSVGESGASAWSTPLIVGSVPDAPTLTSATREIGQSTVVFNPPANNGGLPITGYRVHATDTIVTSQGGQTAIGDGSPIVITGLVDGDAYTFTVTAINDAGESAPSGSSGLVIPGGEPPVQTHDPYPNAMSFRVSKAIGTAQFHAELMAAVHQECLVSVVIDAPLSLDATIWVVPDTLDPGTVQAVIDNHVMDPNYGIPGYVAEFQTIMQKVSADPTVTLDADEVQVALKGILIRLNSGV